MINNNLLKVSLILFIIYFNIKYKILNIKFENYILVLAILLLILSFRNIEKFTTSFDHSDDLVHNLSSVYNDGKLIINNLEVLDKLNVKGSTAFLNSDTTIDGDITFKSGYLKVGEEYFEDYVKKE